MQPLIALGHRPQDTVLVHGKTFGGIRLFVKKEDLQVVVRSVEKESAYDDIEEREAACRTFAQKTPTPPARAEPSSVDRPTNVQYSTYIALYCTKVYFKVVSGKRQEERMAMTRWCQHITLAYLPYLNAGTRFSLNGAVEELLNSWCSTEPRYRPTQLLRSRKFYIQRQGEDLEDRQQGDFINTNWREICELIENDELVFCSEPKAITRQRMMYGEASIDQAFFKLICGKYHDRDHVRVMETTRLEEDCGSKHNLPNMVEISMENTGILNCEMQSLLLYLRELLIFGYGAYHLEPRSDIGLHTKDSWHMTPQTNGLYAKRRDYPDPEYPEYVEAQWPPEDDAVSTWTPMQGPGAPPQREVPQ